MNWKKTMEGNTVEEYVSNKTGMSLAQLTYIAPQYNIYRLHEVRDALFQAKQFGIPVQLISDYDDDGIQSTLIMTYIFAALGLKYHLIIPKRFSEGYGLSMKIIERIPDGCLLITIDNGIKAVDPIAEAKRRNMKVIFWIIMKPENSFLTQISLLIPKQLETMIIKSTVGLESLINWRNLSLGEIIQL